jgi:hypothetical protein
MIVTRILTIVIDITVVLTNMKKNPETIMTLALDS